MPILDVDLLAFETGSRRRKDAVVDGVRRSLATGFVYTSSDLSPQLLDRAYGLLERFFALEPAIKRQFVAEGSSGQTGYTGPLVETAAGHHLADWKEMLNWGDPPGFEHPLRRRFPHLYPEPLLPGAVLRELPPLLLDFHRALGDVQKRFLRVIACGLGVSECFFDDVVNQAPTLSRAIHYPAMAKAPDGGHVWAAPHADINLITAMPRATAPGLQVKVGEDWVDAAPPEGKVIINSGLMLERLSNGLIPAGWHRVLAPQDGASDRMSVVQFCHPRPWTSLAPLPCCCTPENPQRWSGINAADALEDMLHAIGLLAPPS